MRGLMSSLAAIALIAGGVWLVLRGGDEPARPQPTLDAPLEHLVADRRPAPIPEDDGRDEALNAMIRRNNEACDLLQEGAVDAAVALLEECVAAYPEDPLFASNLARALYRRATYEYDRAGGDHHAALTDLRRAVELEPDDPAFTQLLARWERMAAVELGFAGRDSMRFNVSFDVDREDVVDGWHDVVGVLEDAYGEFWLFFNHDPVLESDERMRVVLYGREQFREATGLGHWAGGAYDGVLRILVDDLGSQRSAWMRTVRHELAHAFVASSGGRGVPGWLNEGVAQWLESDGGQAGDRDRDLKAAELRLEGHALRPLTDLSAGFSALGDADAIGRAYAQSLLLVDHLVRYYGESLIAEMIRAGAEDRTAAQAFEERTGFALERVLDDLRDELR